MKFRLAFSKKEGGGGYNFFIFAKIEEDNGYLLKEISTRNLHTEGYVRKVYIENYEICLVFFFSALLNTSIFTIYVFPNFLQFYLTHLTTKTVYS